MGEMRGAYGVLVGKDEGKNHLEDLDIDGRIILRRIFRKWVGRVMDWIDLAHVRERWRARLSAVKNFGFHKMRGIS